MSAHYGLILTKNLTKSEVDDLRGLLTLAIHLVTISAVCIEVFGVTHVRLESRFRQHILCDADERMAQGVESAWELTLAFDLLPLIFHSALITLRAVGRAEYPFRVEIELLVPFNRVLDDSLRGRSDRDDASAVLIFTGRDEVATVDGSLHMDGIFGEISKLKAETLAGT